jgi:arginase
VTTIAVPYHLDERLAALDLGLPVDHEVAADLPIGDQWQRMASLYDQVAALVAASPTPSLVISGDCTTSLGVLAGLQRAGHEIGIVWFDAHADFHTEDTTTSGYVGGMPLALAVGLGTMGLPTALRLRPVPEQRVVLVDARDTDPGEQVLLDRSAVSRARVDDFDVACLPDGPLYLHVDVDVCDPREAPGLLYPAPGGPKVAAVLDALERIAATGRIAAVGVAATWQQAGNAADEHAALIDRISRAVQSSPRPR